MTFIPDSGMLSRLAYFLFYALKYRNAYWGAFSQGQTSELKKKSKCQARELVLKLDQALRTYEKWSCTEFSNLRYIDLDKIERYDLLNFTILYHDDFVLGFDLESKRLLSLFLRKLDEPIVPLQNASTFSAVRFPVISRVGVHKRYIELDEEFVSLSNFQNLLLTVDQVDKVLNSIRVENKIVNFEHLLLLGRYPQCFFSFPYIIFGRLMNISQHTDNISYGQVTVVDSMGSECEVVINIEQLRQENNVPLSFRNLKKWIISSEPHYLLLCREKYPYGNEIPEVISIERVMSGSIQPPSNRTSALRKKYGNLVSYDSYFE